MNILKSDGSTIYRADTGSMFLDSLPESEDFLDDPMDGMAAGDWISKIWAELRIDG